MSDQAPQDGGGDRGGDREIDQLVRDAVAGMPSAIDDQMVERAAVAEYDDWLELGAPERDECRAAARRGLEAALGVTAPAAQPPFDPTETPDISLELAEEMIKRAAAAPTWLRSEDAVQAAYGATGGFGSPYIRPILDALASRLESGAPRADASTVASDYTYQHGRPGSSESFTGKIVGAGEPPAEGTRRWHILEGLKGWLLANPGKPVTSEEEAIDFADAIEGRLVAAAAEHPTVSTPIFTREMLERASAELREGRDVGLVVSEHEGHLRIEEVNHVHPRDFDPATGREVTEEMVTRAIDKGLGGDLDGLGEKFIAEFLRPAVRGILEDILGLGPAAPGGVDRG